FEEIPVVAAQELSNVLKQGYLEKKRRDHSFFGSEWQRRWCVLNNTIFYYFGSEKDKQQKGSFYINGYSAGLVGTLRKDSKRNSCFELSAPGQRSFQFTASSPKEAREWVDQINFVLKGILIHIFALTACATDLSSSFIPFDEDEEDEVEGEDETYDDVDAVTSPPAPRPAPAPQTQEERKGGQPEAEEEDDDIYEVLPEDDFPAMAEEGAEKRQKAAGSVDYANFYQCLWDCEGDEPDELTFNRGDLIYIISKRDFLCNGIYVHYCFGIVGIILREQFLCVMNIL
uniref:Src kinase associated phosphoprotein 1 n=1 Tax=Lepisosteus oculatus TaxID=7918 RepID=W5N7E7_LEPOC